MKILEPIVKETSKNLFQMGPSKALTGPISRGDSELVNDQLLAVKEWDNDAAEIYRLMGKLCVKLSKENDSDKKQADLALIKRLLE